MDRVFLDANVLYSAGYKDTSALRKLWELTEVELLTSFYAVDEARRNLAMDKPGQIESLKQLNAWCELAKPLKRKGGFPDTQTESRLVQRRTPLFSTTVFQ